MSLEDEIIEIQLINPTLVTRKRSAPDIVKVSKMILSSKSEYFRVMLSSGMRESVASKVEICIPPEDRDDFIHFIRFFYQVDLPETANIGKFVEYADQYQTASAMKYALTRLSSPKIFGETLKNLHQVSFLFDRLLDRRVFEQLQSVLEERFSYFDDNWNTDDFFELNGMGLALLFSSSKLKVDCENTIFTAAFTWIQKETNQDWEFFLRQILPHLRFQCMTPDFLNEICEEVSLKEEVRSRIESEARKALYMRSLSWRNKNKNHIVQQPRSGYFAWLEWSSMTRIALQVNLTQLVTKSFYAFGYKMRIVITRDEQGYSFLLNKLWPKSPNSGSYFTWSMSIKNRTTGMYTRILSTPSNHYRDQCWGQKNIQITPEFIYKDNHEDFVDAAIILNLS